MELEDLIASIDIVEYISQFVDLEKRGQEWWGLSPFTDEKTPSFSVRQETQKFYCFSSGLGGNVYSFTKHYYHCSSSDAVRKLQEYAGLEGITIPVRRKLLATKVCKSFAGQKKKQNAAPNKVFPDNYMEQFEKRQDKLQVWISEGISPESLNKFQVYYDEFSNRLVYPIRNLEGKIVNIGGRTLDPDYKSKGLRKYTYFSGWGDMDVVYGLYENMKDIREKQEVVIFEGCKSVMKADSWGIHNTAALLTSHCNPNQMKILAKLGVNVVFALDKEVRLNKDRNINKLKRFVNVEYLWDRWGLIEDKDSPVDHGEEIFKQLYEQRVKLR